MVALPSDTLTLPLLPRIIPRITHHVAAKPKKTKHSSKGLHLSTKQIIIIAVVAAVAVLIFITAIVVFIKIYRRRARKRAPKDAMSMSSSDNNSINMYDNEHNNANGHGGNGDNFNNGYFPPPEQNNMTTMAPRPLGDSLSPELHDVPLTAGLPGGPRYGYGQQVDGLRVPGMAAKPVSYGYNQAPVSHFSPA